MRSPLSGTSQCFAGAPCCCPSSRAHRIEHQRPWPEVRHSQLQPIQLTAPIPLDAPANHGAIANPDFHPGAAAFNARRPRALVLLPIARLLVPALHWGILRGTPRSNRPPPDDRTDSLPGHASRQKPVRHRGFEDLAKQRCSRAKLCSRNPVNPSEYHLLPARPTREDFRSSLARRRITRHLSLATHHCLKFFLRSSSFPFRP